MVNTEPHPPALVRVLIVDDEALVADFFSDLLLSRGCKTTVFNDSLAALANFRLNTHDYDLVLSDICMPLLTGDVLAREILIIRPDMPIVLCSGYSAFADKQKLLDIGIRDFLNKPIDNVKLLKIVEELSIAS